MGTRRRVKLLRPGCPARNLALQLCVSKTAPQGGARAQRPSGGCRLPLSAAHSCSPRGGPRAFPRHRSLCLCLLLFRVAESKSTEIPNTSGLPGSQRRK